jgi:hypothetical protein
MAVASLLLLLQFYTLDWTLFGMGVIALLTGFLVVICYALSRTPREEHRTNGEGSSYRYAPSRAPAEGSVSEPEEAPRSAPSRSSWPPSRTEWTATDTASSPVGGTCLACGATVTEETSACCPECGAERQRCPICQRYVAGGQDLLACIHCRTPGHANEMLAWVEQHQTCPYCARRINASQLRPLQELARTRARKPQSAKGLEAMNDSTRRRRR